MTPPNGRKPPPPAPDVQRGQRVRAGGIEGEVIGIKYSPPSGWWIDVRDDNGSVYSTRKVEVIPA